MPTMIQIQFVTCFRFFTVTNALNFSSNRLYNSWLLLIGGLLWSSSNQIMPHTVGSSLYAFCKVINVGDYSYDCADGDLRLADLVRSFPPFLLRAGFVAIFLLGYAHSPLSSEVLV